MNLESYGPPSQDTGVCLVYDKVGSDLGSLGPDQGSADETEASGERHWRRIVQTQSSELEGSSGETHAAAREIAQSQD